MQAEIGHTPGFFLLDCFISGKTIAIANSADRNEGGFNHPSARRACGYQTRGVAHALA
jgi:hypothetical protein